MEIVEDKFKYTHLPSIDVILSEPDFRTAGDVLLTPIHAKERIVRNHPEFNFNDLDSESLLDMAGCSIVLDRLLEKAEDLERNGKAYEAQILRAKVNLIGNPDISQNETNILSLLDATHGDVGMTESFLRLKNVKDGAKWLNFIIRTWGENTTQLS